MRVPDGRVIMSLTQGTGRALISPGGSEKDSSERESRQLYHPQI